MEGLLLAVERDPMTREELWADVLSLADAHLDELEGLPAAQVRTWLLRTARHLTSNSARRSMARRRLVDRLAREPVAESASAEDEFMESEPSPERDAQVQRLREAWSRLDDAQRAILVMDALGQRGPQIAEQLGITHQAARSRLMRARGAFLNAFNQSVDVDEAGRHE